MSKPRGLKYISLVPGGGYGDAACEYVAGLDALGVPVSWMPTRDNSAELLPRAHSTADIQDAIRPRLDYLWDREIACDALLLNVPPVRWHGHWLDAEPGLRHYCYVAWEADVLPPDWAPALNRYQCVFVPSQFNRRVLVEGGVTSRVECMPHIARKVKPAPQISGWGSITDDEFVFYTIGAWTTRKAMEETIRAYLDAFSGTDKVTLVVKTEAVNQIVYQSLTAAQRQEAPPHHSMVWWALSKIIADYPNPAKIHLLAGRVEPAEIDRLHSRGNCFVSLAHSEGWGLGAFDAALFGNPVIITGWGGQLDYLGASYPLLIKYQLSRTSDFPDDGYFLHGDDVHWATADREHASSLMRAVFENSTDYQSVARTLQGSIKRNYSATTVCAKLAEYMGYTTQEK
jgi:glycosyltransferase involved in cell wall biosynthesis